MSSTKVEIHSQVTYPIRMYCEGWHKLYNVHYRDKNVYISAATDQNTPTVFTLSNTFASVNQPAIHPDLLQLLRLSRDQNTNYFNYIEDKWESGFKELYHHHQPDLLRILKAKGASFKNWASYYNDMQLNTNAIEELPALQGDDYTKDVTAIKIKAKCGDNTQAIALLLPPRTLFNAIVMAENTGAALAYNAPTDIRKQGHLSVYVPKSAKKTTTLN